MLDKYNLIIKLCKLDTSVFVNRLLDKYNSVKLYKLDTSIFVGKLIK